MCHEKSIEVSERDLILAPRFPRTRRVCLAELISFQIKGLSHESRGEGPEKGKASEQVDLSLDVTSLQREKTLAEGLDVKSSHRVSKYATAAGSENFCLSQAGIR